MAPIKVINASLGRTGTSSFCEAMDILGYKCHHMKRLLADPTFETSKPFYEAALNRDEADWDKVYAGYDVTTDFTGAYFWKHLFARYPDAKVILTERPFEEWFKSMQNTIYPVIRTNVQLEPDHPRYTFRQLTRRVVLEGYIEDDAKYLDEDFMRKYYNDHIEEVKRTVPANQLYSLKLGGGWEGLCEFLGKDVPDEPYPNVNSTAQFNEKVRLVKARIATAAAATAAATPGETEDTPLKDLTIGVTQN
ncbi:hypothetical protein PS15m_000320 [Mucor circinelloides]